MKEFRVTSGKGFRLKRHDPGFTGPYRSKADAEGRLERALGRMRSLQGKLYAQDRWSLLVIFQALDAAGKDSTIEHVMSGLNPQGCQVFSFKAPSAEELDHDFLWRTSRCLPERGRIGVFNRSYYEEVLVVRVHPELLHKEKLPPAVVGKNIWKERFEDICGLERYLWRQGTVIVKFFLNVSKDVQRERFLARLNQPEKNWKFSLQDAKEREHWSDYQRAYEDMIAATATKHAPWHVIPADHKWFTRLAVAEIIVARLRSLGLGIPQLSPEQLRELDEARKMLGG